MKAYKIFHNFADSTTLHGVQRIIRAKVWYKRFFWLLMFVGATAMLGFQLSQLLVKYFAFEKRVIVDIRQPDVASLFPWITICNLRSFDVVVLRHIYQLFSLNKTEKHRFMRSYENHFVRQLNFFYDNVIFKTQTSVENSSTSKESGGIAFDWSPTVLFSFNESLLEDASTQHEDFFLNYYKSTVFQMRILFSLGVPMQCFTVQSPSDFHRPILSLTVLDGNGMLPKTVKRRRVPSNIDRLFGSSIERTGLVVIFHRPNTKPQLLLPNQYIAMLHGQIGTFYVNTRSTERLDLQYSMCTNTYPFSPHPAGVYVQATCYEGCLLNKTMAICGCKDEYSAFLDNDNETDDIPFCHSLRDLMTPSSAKFTLEYLREVLSRYKRNNECWSKMWLLEPTNHCKMACPRACEEYTYDIDKTIVSWPTYNGYKRSLIKNYIDKLVAKNDTVRLQLLKENINQGYQDNDDSNEYYQGILLNSVAKRLTHLHFELKSNDLPVTKEILDYTIYQLLSDIGGQLGLWIGMSVITLLEVIDLIFNLMKLIYRKCTSRKRCHTMHNQNDVCEAISLNIEQLHHVNTADNDVIFSSQMNGITT